MSNLAVEFSEERAAERLDLVSRIVSLDEKARRIRHVISTARLDRNRRIADVEGWRLANFKKAPRVLANHDYSIESVIGRAYDVAVEGRELVSTTEFDSEGLGAVAFRLVQAGLVNTWSVGWIGLKMHRFGEIAECDVCAAAAKKSEFGRHYTQQELLEYSLVAVSANPDALSDLCRSGLVARDEVDAWADRFGVASLEEEPEEPDAEIERDPAFFTEVSNAARIFARRAAALRGSQRVRRIR